MSVKFPEPKNDNNASGLRIAIIYSRFNEKYTSALAEDCKNTLIENNVEAEDIFVLDVPGAYELPFAASKVALSLEPHAVIVLGAVIAGDTNHHLAIEQSVAISLQGIAMDYSIPMINGVITVENEQQAIDRCLDPMRRGKEFAHVAIEMATKSIFLDTINDINPEE